MLCVEECPPYYYVETIGQMSMFAGIPATTRAMELVQEVLAEQEGSDT